VWDRASAAAYGPNVRVLRSAAILGACLWALTYAMPSSAIEGRIDQRSASSFSVAQALKRIDGTKCGVDANSPAPLTLPVGVIHSDGINAVLVGGCVNGLGPFPFVVDTGAGVTVFGQSLVSRLKLARTGASAKIQALGCTASASDVDVRDWSIGGRALAPQDVVSLKSRKLRR